MTWGLFVAHPTAGTWVGRLAAQQKGQAASLYMLAFYLGAGVALAAALALARTAQGETH